MADSIKNPSNAPAPAGFREITGEGPWQSEFHGPEAHHGNVAVTSVWNHISREIEFDVYSSVDGHANFDREELEVIPELIKKVLAKIDQAHAVVVMTSNPVPRANPEWHTVTETSALGFSPITAPVELHCWPKKDISAGIETRSLCGEIAVPAQSNHLQNTGTSYTCPDCMFRYSLLVGDDNA